MDRMKKHFLSCPSYYPVIFFCPIQRWENMVKYTDYRKELIEDLKDHDEATAYLNGAREESLKGGEESQKLFCLALRTVVEAQGL